MTDPVSQLYYAGFNRHLNLVDDPGTLDGSLLNFYQSSSDNNPPPELAAFTRVKHSANRVSLLTATWCDFTFLSNNKLWHAGHRPNGDTTDLRELQLDEGIGAEDLEGVFGDPVGGVVGAVTKSGALLLKSELGEEGKVFRKTPILVDGQTLDVDGAAIGGDGQLYVACRSQDQSMVKAVHLLNGQATLKQTIFGCDERTRYVVAGSTAIALLTVTGRVFTSGSPLQPALLARAPDKSNPAAELCSVEALDGMEIAKICMSEWLAGALSADQDLYLWGGRAGEKTRIGSLPTTDEDVKLVDIAGGVDIADFSIGMGHVIVLTVAGEVWGCGENDHGQLGLGNTSKTFTPDWVRVSNSWNGDEVQQVVAGGYGTWLLTRRPPAS